MILLTPSRVLSQDFIRALQVAGNGPDFVNGVATDSDGNIIIDGRFQYSVDFDPSDNEAILESISNNDIFFAKYSPTGEYIWAKQMSVGSAEGSRCDKNDNIYLTGYTLGQLDLDPSEGEAIVNAEQKQSVFLAKYNSQGEYIWGFAVQSKNGGTSSFDVEVDDQGNYVYIAGTCSDTMDFDPSENTYNLVTQNFQDFFVAKYTLDGEFVWVKHLAFQGYGYGYIRTIAIDNTGNIYIGGNFQGTLDMDPGEESYLITSAGEFNDDAFLAKYNSSGEVQWAFPLGSESFDIIWTIRCYNEKIYAAGSFYETVDFDPSDATFELTASEGEENGFLAIYNDDGSFDKVMGMIGTGEETGGRVNDMGIDTDGNIYLLGSFYGTIDVDPSEEVHTITGTGRDYDMFLSKYSADGYFNWAIHTNGNDQEQGYFLKVVDNNHAVAFGYFDGNCDFDPSDGTAYLYHKGGHDIYMAWYSTTPGSYVDEKIFSSSLQIAPNPTNSNCKLQFNVNTSTSMDIKVIDLCGREIYKVENIELSQGMQEINIPSQLLKPGIYLVQEMVQGRKYAQKLVRY